MPGAFAAPSSKSKAETAVARFYDTLTDEQKKQVAFGFDHKNRTKVSANWHIAEPLIGEDFYTKEQQALIDEILKDITTEEGYKKLRKQMEEDDGGMQSYSVAIFGDPSTDKYEWVMTGRHLTLRADGNTVPGAAFGGPIVYGHGESNPTQNLFYDQTKMANAVFSALDAEQAKQALLPKSPQENRVPLQGKNGKFPGVAVSDLSKDQQKLVSAAIKNLLGIYRKEDVEEVMAVLKQGGGLDKLHIAFYSDKDLRNDKIWDVWRIEGPTMVWHFRGAPHVHAYINIGLREKG
jgi:hypothetical protein